MRQVTKDAAAAFKNSKKFTSRNTTVVVRDNGDVEMRLFDNLIAKKDSTGKVQVSNAGWSSPTTAERLRGLGARVSIVDRSMRLDGKVWDGKFTPLSSDEEPDGMSHLRSVAGVAMLGDIFADTTQEKNNWKKRMLTAGLENRGLLFPDDWDTLSEEEKERRLDGAIKSI